MQKHQWLGEVTLGSNIPTLTGAINSLFENIQNEEQTDNIEVHQVVSTGPSSYFIILNFYK